MSPTPLVNYNGAIRQDFDDILWFLIFSKIFVKGGKGGLTTYSVLHWPATRLERIRVMQKWIYAQVVIFLVHFLDFFKNPTSIYILSNKLVKVNWGPQEAKICGFWSPTPSKMLVLTVKLFKTNAKTLKSFRFRR